MSVSDNYSTGSDKAIVDIIKEQILMQASDFGGSCHFTEGDETCTQARNNQQARISDASRELIASSTSVREGFRLNACSQLVSRDRAVENFIFNVTGKRDTAFIYNEHAKPVYNKFYARPYTGEIHEGLGQLYKALSSANEDNIDVWRLMISAVCKSPGWQVP